MLEALVVADGHTTLRRIVAPAPRAGWSRVRVLLAGICRTDVFAADGTLPTHGPRVLGHELVGEVLEGAGCGRRVTVNPLLPGPRMLGVDVDGAFADEVLVPDSALVEVPRALPLPRAAYVEPIAAALAVQKAPLPRHGRGLILGAGRIAELTLRVLRALGSVDVVAATAHEGGVYDFVIETAGTAASHALALQQVRAGGVVVLKSRPAAPIPIDVARAVTHDLTLCAVGYAPFEEAVEWAARLEVDDLLGRVWPLHEGVDAIAAVRAHSLLPKQFLRPRGAGECAA